MVVLIFIPTKFLVSASIPNEKTDSITEDTLVEPTTINRTNPGCITKINKKGIIADTIKTNKQRATTFNIYSFIE